MGDTAAAETRDRPTVSIVVPVLDGAAFIEECLDSILAQIYPLHEVIVMDDGSTDDTPAIVARYGDRVRYVRQPETKGIYENANDGIALASGDLIGVFHANDVYLPEMVAREVEWLEQHPEAAVVFCSDIFIDAEGRRLDVLELPPDVRGSKPLEYPTVLNALMKYTNVFPRTPTALVRASVYRELGGYRGQALKNTAEIDMWLRIARVHAVGTLEERLILRRRHGGSSAGRYHRMRTDRFRFFDVMDAELARGGRDVATREAIVAYDAHQSVDAILRTVNHYILGDRAAARSVLREARLRRIAASPYVQRGRMLLLGIGLHALVRLPRMEVVGRLFARHWYGTGAAAGSS
jgi:glycosyltransferase involved in cell wall biosynthesis